MNWVEGRSQYSSFVNTCIQRAEQQTGKRREGAEKEERCNLVYIVYNKIHVFD